MKGVLSELASDTGGDEESASGAEAAAQIDQGEGVDGSRPSRRADWFAGGRLGIAVIARRLLLSRRCYALLTKHRGLMDEMTERLIAEETIDYTDLEKMRDEHLKTLEAVSASSAAA